MVRKKKKKPAIGSDPFSENEEIMRDFFSPQSGKAPSSPSPDRGPEQETNNKAVPSPPPTPSHGPPDEKKEKPPQPKSVEPIVDEAMLAAFKEEMGEGLERLDELLVNLEKNPNDSELINEVFRIVHTIKGSSGFMDFENLKGLCHRMENLLSKVRDGKFQITVPVMDIVLEGVDKMKEFRQKIEEQGNEGDVEAGDVVFMLEALIAPPGETPVAEQRASAPPVEEEKKEAASETPEAPSGMDVPKELIDEFLSEAREGIDQLDEDLVALEDNPEDKELLNKVFRIMHTLKGGAGFFGFTGIQNTAHNSEDILNKIRTGEMSSDSHIVDVLLEALDVVKSLMMDLSDTGRESTDCSIVIRRLKEMLSGSFTPAAPAAAKADSSKTGPPPARPVRQTSFAKQTIHTIRVDVERLDSLMNLAGELVLARNRQVQLSKDIDREIDGHEKICEEVGGAVNQLDFITTEIQYAVMQTRMLPVSTVFGKFTRVVRDLSRSLGKEVNLIIEGESTELDKNVIEEIGDPMVHLIRNAVDHGIEMPDERERGGKDRKGTVNLSAYYEGSHVIIEIRDDGNGMDPEKLKAKAVEKGIITEEEAGQMVKAEALKLIFAAGFSTAEKVSDVSGRGVGMDVVRSNIEKLKGVIDLESEPGHGSKVKIKIPLTLAILPTLHCKVGPERYAIPLATVKETVRVDVSHVETIRGKRVVKLRDEILPLLFLHEVLDVETSPASEICVVVLQIGIQKLGCVVDDTIGQEEVVIKSLDFIKDIAPTQFVSGAAILGNGVITLILDVAELMRLGHATTFQEEEKAELEQEERQREKDLMQVLLVEDGGAEQYALPIRSIMNIENISSREIESVGGRKVVRHEGEVLPVVNLYDITNFPTSAAKDEVYLIILGGDGEKAGLAVNRLKGMKEIHKSDMEDCFSSAGVAFSIVLDNRVTLILAEGAVVERSKGATLSNAGGHLGGAASGMETRGNILVVDDSPVARGAIKGALEKEGYIITTAVDGKDGLEKLSGIDLVVTDLEMPNMNGYDFTRAIKKDYALPVIMVTTLDGEEDRLEGLKAGVDDYQVKLDTEKLVRTIKRHMKKKIEAS